MSRPDILDIAIVGAGPVGLFAAFYAGMRQMSIHLIDSLSAVGGQLSALYPEKLIYDAPGYREVMAKDLVNELWNQAQLGKPKLSLNSYIEKIDSRIDDEGKAFYELEARGGARFYSRSVILATGAGAFTPRTLNVPGIEERLGSSVHYIVKPLSTYKDKNVLVVGGGDSAVDWALAFGAHQENSSGPKEILCRTTTVIHRGQDFTAHEASAARLKASPTRIHFDHQLTKIEDSASGSLRASVTHNESGTTQKFDVDHVVLCLGFVASSNLLKRSELKLEKNAVVVNERFETELPNIYAVGDGCTHSVKLKLIATGFAEAAIAVNSAKSRIDTKAAYFPGHSTNKLKPVPKGFCELGKSVCDCGAK